MSVSTKSKADKGQIDEIEPIEKVVEESEDGTEVISVKLSKDRKPKIEDSIKKEETKEVKEDKILSEDVSEPKEEHKVEDEEEVVQKVHDSDTATKQVSSFSQLDADKVAEESKEDVKETPKEVEDTSEVKSTEILDSGDDNKKPDEKYQEVLTDDVKKWLEDIHPAGKPDDSGKSGFGLKGVFIILLLLGILGLIGGGFYFYQTSQSNSSATPTPVPTETSVSPTPTLVAEVVDLTKYTVQVLNGTTISGEAGRVAGELETAGFVDVAAGNASTSTVKETTVQMKEGVSQQVFKTIESTLNELQVVMADEVLPETSKYDVVVTLGTTEKSTEVTQ